MNPIIPFETCSSLNTTLKLACLPIGHITKSKFEQRVQSINQLAQSLDHSRLIDTNSPSTSPFTSFNQPTAKLEVSILTLPINVLSSSIDERYSASSIDQSVNQSINGFISLIENGEWDEFVPLNHVFAVIGIADGDTSESMEECYSHYAKLKAALPSNQSAAQSSQSINQSTQSSISIAAPKLPFRCQFFAFGFDYDGLGYDDAITVPLDSDSRALSYASACLHGLVSNLMHDAECWVAEVLKSEQTLVLKSPLDVGAINTSMLPSSSSPLNALESVATKVRKQRIGRQQKAIGDLCLVFGCPFDALLHNRQAVDSLKSCNDVPWLASAYESQAAALYANEKRGSVKLFNDTIYQLLTDSASMYASISGGAFLCISSSFKLARYLASHGRAVEAIDLLMRTNELPLDLSAHQQVELAVNAGKFAADVGAMRKFAFLLVQAAAVYEELHQFDAAIKLLRFAMPVYGLGTINSSLEHIPATSEHQDATSTQGKDTQCQWPGIQHTLLEHFIYNSVKSKDFVSAVHATLLMQKCAAKSELLDAEAQAQLCASLLDLTATLPVDLLVRDCGIPQVNFIRPLPANSDRQPVRSVSLDQNLDHASTNDVFLFNPADARSDPRGAMPSLTFSARDQIVFEISMDNRLSVPVEVQKITIIGEACDFHSYSASFCIAPRSKDQRFLITGTTNHSGVLQIQGCYLRCFNLTHVIDIDQFGNNSMTGSVISSTKEGSSLVRVDNLEIVDTLPLITMSIVDSYNTLLDGQFLFENQQVNGQVQLCNDGQIDVEYVELKILPLFAALSAESQAAYYSQFELEAEKEMRVRRKSSASKLIPELPVPATIRYDSTLLKSHLPLTVGQSVELPFRMVSSVGLIGLQFDLTYSSQKSAQFGRHSESKVSWLTSPVAEIKHIDVQPIDSDVVALVMLVENFSRFEICVMLHVDGVDIGSLGSQVIGGHRQPRLIFTFPRFDPPVVDASFPFATLNSVQRMRLSIVKRLQFTWNILRGVVRQGQLPLSWSLTEEQIRSLVKPFARLAYEIPGRCCSPPHYSDWIGVSAVQRVVLGEAIQLRIRVTPLAFPSTLVFECLSDDVLIAGSPIVQLDDESEVEHLLSIVILTPGKHHFTVAVKPSCETTDRKSIYGSDALFSLTTDLQ